jgi:hypothetical protein
MYFGNIYARHLKSFSEFDSSSSGSSKSGSGSGSASDSDKSSPEKSSDPVPTKSSHGKSRQSASDLKQVKKSAPSASNQKTEVGGNMNIICDALCFHYHCAWKTCGLVAQVASNM